MHSSAPVILLCIDNELQDTKSSGNSCFQLTWPAKRTSHLFENFTLAFLDTLFLFLSSFRLLLLGSFFFPFLLLNSMTGKWSSSEFKLGSFSLFTLHALLGHYFNSSGFKLHPYACHPHTYFHFRPLFWATDTYNQLLPCDPYLVVHGCLEKVSQGQISTLNHPSQMPTLNLFYPWAMHFSKCQLHEIICTSQKSRSHQHFILHYPLSPILSPSKKITWLIFQNICFTTVYCTLLQSSNPTSSLWHLPPEVLWFPLFTFNLGSSLSILYIVTQVLYLKHKMSYIPSSP